MDNSLQSIRERYSNYSVARLGYATVRDYCDSMDHLRDLATINNDMKDVQRPWMLKAIIANMPIGSRLLEIGAGEPFVADILERMGYDVTVVDPYEGCGNGPIDYGRFVRGYPRIRFIRDNFSERLKTISPCSIDCIYSISVLEHISTEELPAVFSGMRNFIRPNGGMLIHAIDHVLKGNGDQWHYDMLREMINEVGIPEEELERMTRRLEDDPDTYFLSAFSHNLWRGSLPYDEFSMRRCISVQICAHIDDETSQKR